MRKRTINHLGDTIFWYLLYFLPIICFGILLAVGQVNTLNECMTLLGLGVSESSIVYTTLNAVIGASGIIPMFADFGIIKFFTWFANVLISHLLVDFVLFIPRLAHKYLKIFYQGE